MATVKEQAHELQQRRIELKDLFEAHKQDDGTFDFSAEQLEEVNRRNDELTVLNDKYQAAKQADELYQKNAAAIKANRQPAAGLPLNGQPAAPSAPIGRKGEGEQLIDSLFDSKSYEQWQQHKGDINYADETFDFKKAFMEFKTTMSTSAGFAPETTRTGRMVDYATRRPMVADLIPQTTTTQTAVVYMEETTQTNNADTIAEAGTYPEGAHAWTERSQTVRKIGEFLPVTDEQLDDVPQMRSLINNRLMLMLMLAEETQLLNGSGNSPDLEGFLQKSGVQTQAKGSDSVQDACYKALTKVRHTGFADPTAYIFHPNDWEAIRLTTTTDGIYIWGSPAETGVERLWGLPVIVTTAQTENTALTGDFPLYSEIVRKQGINIKVSDSHSDYFVNGKQAIRIDERLALCIYRAAAFCKVTGI